MARARTSGGRRADLRWTLGTATVNALAAGANSFVTVVAAGNTSQTIMRTRGELLVYLDGAQAPAVLMRCAAGLLVQQSGATPTSTPLTDGDAPFFWYDVFHLGHEESVLDAIEQVGCGIIRHMVDAKAMRVLRPDQEIALVVETATAKGSSAVNFALTARFLIAD